jgi:hypothetical protein
MEKCQTCQFYDRRLAGPHDGKGPQWGQCRRTSPQLHPINAKSYMVEGVWPHVRDDDWCGEWKHASRRPETTAHDTLATPLMGNVGTPPARLTGLTSVPGSASSQPVAAGVPLLSPALGALRGSGSD